MKQIIKIALLFFYMFFNAGLSYSMHFCGEDYQRINLYSETKTCCPNEEPMPGCCDDISNFELPNTDQQFVEAVDFQAMNFEIVPHINVFSEFPSGLILEQSAFEFADSSPPFLTDTPLYIINQVFLI